MVSSAKSDVARLRNFCLRKKWHPAPSNFDKLGLDFLYVTARRMFLAKRRTLSDQRVVALNTVYRPRLVSGFFEYIEERSFVPT